MRGKLGASQSDEEFVRAADEVLRHIQAEHGCAAVAAIGTSERRTVVMIAITAHRTGAGDRDAVVAAVKGEFPNSRAATLAAYVYSLTVTLDHILDAQEKGSQG